MFAGCDSLSSMRISIYNGYLSYQDGVIYDKDKKIVYAMLPGYEGSVYNMPSTVKEIKSNAFWGCKN